jgi:hypothetical protein
MNVKPRFVASALSSGSNGGAHAHGTVPKRHIIPFVRTHIYRIDHPVPTVISFCAQKWGKKLHGDCMHCAAVHT